MNGPEVEGGIVVGNTYDKYGTRNPVARRLVRGFLAAFDELVDRSGARSILEVGCGEGELSLRAAGPDRRVVGTDISHRMIEVAESRSGERGSRVAFRQCDLFALDPADATYDLVLCCEVLEHLEDPEGAIRHLATLSDGHLLLSVPREPIWRLLNIARGRYLRSLGNTPGHIQHWSKRSFLRLVRRHLRILEARTPLPWVMTLCSVHDEGAGRPAR